MNYSVKCLVEGLERWLSSYEQSLLLQRNQAQFPTRTLSGSQPPVIPGAGESDALLWSLQELHAHGTFVDS